MEPLDSNLQSDANLVGNLNQTLLSLDHQLSNIAEDNEEIKVALRAIKQPTWKNPLIQLLEQMRQKAGLLQKHLIEHEIDVQDIDKKSLISPLSGLSIKNLKRNDEQWIPLQVQPSPPQNHNNISITLEVPQVSARNTQIPFQLRFTSFNKNAERLYDQTPLYTEDLTILTGIRANDDIQTLYDLKRTYNTSLIKEQESLIKTITGTINFSPALPSDATILRVVIDGILLLEENAFVTIATIPQIIKGPWEFEFILNK